MNKEQYEVTKLLRQTEATLAFHLDCFGDKLAESQSYKEVNGIEAVQYYLIQKHNWLPSQVQSMSSEDLRFALSEEMSGYILPPEARGL